jgi:predicted RNase H-like HicB family nuclease
VEYLVILEGGPGGSGAHVPDLPGCIAAGASREEVLRLIRDAIAFHIEGMKEAGGSVPRREARARSELRVQGFQALPRQG